MPMSSRLSSTFLAGRRLRLGALCLMLLLIAAVGLYQVSLVTVGWDGQQTDGLSRHFSVARNGDLISLMSEATNLVPDDTNGVRDIFVVDRRLKTTVRVSIGTGGKQADGESGSGVLSENGRYIAFHSVATNLVPGDTNGLNDVFLRDLKTDDMKRITVGYDGSETDGGAAWPAISKNGRFVAYRSGATNLVPGDTNGVADVFVYDLKKGTTTRITRTVTGAEIDMDAIRHALSPNGRYVGVLTAATNIVPGDTNGHADVFIYDLRKDTITLASRGLGGEPGDGGCFQPNFSRNARYVAFPSYAANLVPDDNNGVTDVFVYDMKRGFTERCSVNSAGVEGNGDCYVTNFARNGRILYFDSHASNLVPDDNNDSRDVFVHDRKTGRTERVSLGVLGQEGNANSYRPRTTRNGKLVAIFSEADNLVPDDLNGVLDVFVIEEE